MGDKDAWGAQRIGIPTPLEENGFRPEYDDTVVSAGRNAVADGRSTGSCRLYVRTHCEETAIGLALTGA